MPAGPHAPTGPHGAISPGAIPPPYGAPQTPPPPQSSVPPPFGTEQPPVSAAPPNPQLPPNPDFGTNAGAARWGAASGNSYPGAYSNSYASGFPPHPGAPPSYTASAPGYPAGQGGFAAASFASPFAAPPPVVWGAPPVRKRRSTGLRLLTIIVAFAVAVGLVNVAWDIFTPDRTEVPIPENVTIGANGLPEGYEWAGDLQAGGDKLICGPVTWELIGDAPSGGRKAVEQAVELTGQMTGVTIRPVEDVATPAVKITFEYVPSSELRGASNSSQGDAIGLAITQHTSFGITESEILLDETYFKTTMRSNHDEAVLVVVHEIGHAFGLGHSDLRDSVMYPVATGQTRIAEEDVAAFATIVPDC
ncbi:MAG: matrixin family metalloprotease [Bifidobacteriaceae bacterium]|nr:matrixin family metalloprotease [Bifidobacteriaceae bacterium]